MLCFAWTLIKDGITVDIGLEKQTASVLFDILKKESGEIPASTLSNLTDGLPVNSPYGCFGSSGKVVYQFQ